MTVAELTAEAIDSMPAGREMDALVAEHVIGWKLEHFWPVSDMRSDRSKPCDRWQTPLGIEALDGPSFYSTAIVPAMAAADLFPEFRLRRVHWADMLRHMTDSGEQVAGTHGEAGNYANGWWAAATTDGELLSIAETASLAICRATLIAKLVEQMTTNVVIA